MIGRKFCRADRTKQFSTIQENQPTPVIRTNESAQKFVKNSSSKKIKVKQMMASTSHCQVPKREKITGYVVQKQSREHSKSKLKYLDHLSPRSKPSSKLKKRMAYNQADRNMKELMSTARTNSNYGFDSTKYNVLSQGASRKENGSKSSSRGNYLPKI